jgi:hypothetical protein
MVVKTDECRGRPERPRVDSEKSLSVLGRYTGSMLTGGVFH